MPHFGKRHLERHVTMLSSADTQVFKTVCPVIVITGIFGNIMNFVIICRLWKQFQAFSYYFLAQTVTDLCLLTLVMLPRWAESLAQLRLEFPVEGQWLCKIDAWILYTATCVSAWVRTAMAFQRMVVVVWPQKARSKLAFLRKMTKVVLLFIVAINIALQANILFGEVLILSNCYLGSTKFLDMDTLGGLVQTWLNFAFTCVVPFIVIFISNTTLLITLLQSNRVCAASGSTTNSTSDNGIFRLSKTYTLTVTIMGTALAYCLLLTPVYLLEALVVSGVVPGDQISANTWSVLVLMIITNAAVSFFIYVVSGYRFRQEAKNLMEVFRKLLFPRRSQVVPLIKDSPH